jgi:hypothetical protein
MSSSISHTLALSNKLNIGRQSALFEHINMNGERVFSSILGMDFDSYDGENEQLTLLSKSTASLLRTNYVRS